MPSLLPCAAAAPPAAAARRSARHSCLVPARRPGNTPAIRHGRAAARTCPAVSVPRTAPPTGSPATTIPAPVADMSFTLQDTQTPRSVRKTLAGRSHSRRFAKRSSLTSMNSDICSRSPELLIVSCLIAINLSRCFNNWEALLSDTSTVHEEFTINFSSNSFALWCCFASHKSQPSRLFKIFRSIVDKMYALRICATAAAAPTRSIIGPLPKGPISDVTRADSHPTNQCIQHADKFTIHLNPSRRRVEFL